MGKVPPQIGGQSAAAAVAIAIPLLVWPSIARSLRLHRFLSNRNRSAWPNERTNDRTRAHSGPLAPSNIRRASTVHSDLSRFFIVMTTTPIDLSHSLAPLPPPQSDVVVHLALSLAHSSFLLPSFSFKSTSLSLSLSLSLSFSALLTPVSIGIIRPQG